MYGMHIYLHKQKPKAMRFLLFMQVAHCFTHAVAIKVSPPVY